MNPFFSTEKIRLAFSRKKVQNYNKWAYPQKQTAKQLAAYFHKNIDKKMKNLLDAGCGTGLLSQYLHKLYPNCSITGLDISTQMIEEYKKLKLPNTYISNMENTPFQNQHFDATLSSFSLHWTNIEKTIKEFIRISKYYIAFSIPVQNSIQSFNFPFYKTNYIINITKKYCHNINIYNEKINIPYTNLNLIKYFHYTGVSQLNPNKPIKKLMKKTKLQNFIQSFPQKELYYNILYIIARL